jgi:hypothetical protein
VLDGLVVVLAVEAAFASFIFLLCCRVMTIMMSMSISIFMYLFYINFTCII